MPTILTGYKLKLNTANSITITDTGIYLVIYNVNTVDDVENNGYVSVAINGTIQNTTNRPLSSKNAVSGSFVLALKENDQLTLVPTVNTTTKLTNNGGASASLSVVRIS